MTLKELRTWLKPRLAPYKLRMKILDTFLWYLTLLLMCVYVSGCVYKQHVYLNVSTKYHETQWGKWIKRSWKNSSYKSLYNIWNKVMHNSHSSYKSLYNIWNKVMLNSHSSYKSLSCNIVTNIQADCGVSEMTSLCFRSCLRLHGWCVIVKFRIYCTFTEYFKCLLRKIEYELSKIKRKAPFLGEV